MPPLRFGGGCSPRYPTQLDAVKVLGCTHIAGNLVVQCPGGRAFEERCRMQIQSTFRKLSCRDPTEQEIDEFMPHCVAVPSAAFGVENPALSQSITLNATSTCGMAPMGSILHLNALKNVRVVTGSISVSGCPKLTTLGGGLSRLEAIGSTTQHDGAGMASHLRISNTGLRGSLARMLPTLVEFSLVADIADNSELCATPPDFDWPASWSVTGNAKRDQCGCTFPVALNYNKNALFDDDSCQMTGCNLCHAGTHGPCSFTDDDGDFICSASLDVRTSDNPTFFRCHAGATACTQDLCKDVVCDNPPPCQTVISSSTDAGKCLEGVCLYNFAQEGDTCDDKLPGTGPDRCNSNGECIGQTSCVVAEMGGTPDALYGASVQTAAQVELLAGCVEIQGHLHIDGSAAANGAGITSLAPLATLKKVTGALVIHGCGGLASLRDGLGGLVSVEGEAFGSSLVVTDNANLTGSLPTELPSLVSGEWPERLFRVGARPKWLTLPRCNDTPCLSRSIRSPWPPLP